MYKNTHGILQFEEHHLYIAHLIAHFFLVVIFRFYATFHILEKPSRFLLAALFATPKRIIVDM